MNFNQFTGLPQIPYKIFNALLDNDDLFKLLYYSTYDALSQPALTIEQKMGMLWQGQSNMENYNIFLTNIKPNMELESKTILKIYRYTTSPTNKDVAKVAYKFDVLYGSTIPLVEYEGITCNRGDVIEMELMKTLNGSDTAGVGYLQYNEEMSRLCGSAVGIGNDYTFTGVSIVMVTVISNTKQGDTCG